MHLLNKLPEYLANATPMTPEQWTTTEQETLLSQNALRLVLKGVQLSVVPDVDQDFPAEATQADPVYQAILKAGMSEDEYARLAGEGQLFVSAQEMVWWCEPLGLGVSFKHLDVSMFAIGDGEEDLIASDSDSENDEAEEGDKKEEEEEESEGRQHFFVVIDVPTLTVVSGEEVKPVPVEFDESEAESENEADEAEDNGEEEEEEDSGEEADNAEHEHGDDCCHHQHEVIPPFWCLRMWMPAGEEEANQLEQLYDAVADCAKLHPNGENMEEMDEFELLEGEEISDDDDEEAEEAETQEAEEAEEEEEPAAKEARLE